MAEARVVRLMDPLPGKRVRKYKSGKTKEQMQKQIEANERWAKKKGFADHNAYQRHRRAERAKDRLQSADR